MRRHLVTEVVRLETVSNEATGLEATDLVLWKLLNSKATPSSTTLPISYPARCTLNDKIRGIRCSWVLLLRHRVLLVGDFWTPGLV